MSAALPRLIAHRGARRLAPENTLAALRLAAAAGAPWVEFDVKLSADGELLLMHDELLERTTSGRGPVSDMRWKDLAKLDAGSWFGKAFARERVPGFLPALALLGKLGLGANIEIKPCPGREEETGRAVAMATARHWPAHLPPPVLSSFALDSLAAAREAAPDLLRGLLVEAVPDDWRQRLGALECVSLHAEESRLTAPLVRAVKAAGVPLLAYTVNDPDRARTLRAWGVDALVTDDVAALRGI
ncbi:MAG TPA: glycerophosphodiester phosphodiesterase [Planctomycetota bacterium]|nr:glycerophosphodiester phosphodiesterase [Planctomycetota bacterium]